jgi:hypothetical protein
MRLGDRDPLPAALDRDLVALQEEASDGKMPTDELRRKLEELLERHLGEAAHDLTLSTEKVNFFNDYSNRASTAERAELVRELRRRFGIAAHAALRRG